VTYINHTVRGIPFSRHKSRGNTSAAKTWTDEVIAQTSRLPKVKEACALKVTFLLPPDKFPGDYPFGPDLDNLLKRMMDALERTIFAEARGGDSCVVLLHVMKTKVKSKEEAGAHIEVLPVSVAS